MEDKSLQKISFKKGRLLLLLLLIFFISGCYVPGPKAPEVKPFEKVIKRVAEDEEGYEVIDFIEKADILDFLNLEANDPKITERNSPNKFIRNISQALITIERDYTFQGFLNYSIDAKFISIENYTKTSWFFDTTGLICYTPNGVENGTKIEELSPQNNVNAVLSKMNLIDNVWLVTMFIHSWFLHAGYRVGEVETSTYYDAVYLLNPEIKFIAIIAR